MNNLTERQRFDEAVGVLIAAYMNDTLEHSNCYACAVGNMIAHANNIRIKPGLVRSAWQSHIPPYWYSILKNEEGHKKIGNFEFLEKGHAQMQSTGYSRDELDRIEIAFESAADYPNTNPDPFNGLIAVVDVLADIHGIDLTVIEETKQSLLKAQQVRACEG